jgi:hypothetical protein
MTGRRAGDKEDREDSHVVRGLWHEELQSARRYFRISQERLKRSRFSF